LCVKNYTTCVKIPSTHDVCCFLTHLFLECTFRIMRSYSFVSAGAEIELVADHSSAALLKSHVS